MWFHPDPGNRSDVPKFQPPLRGVGVTGPPQIQDQIIPMHSAHWERSAMLFFSSPSWEGMTQAMGTSWTEWVNGTNIKLNEGLCIHWYPLPFLKTKGLFGDFILLKRPNLMSPWFSMICKMACMVVRMYCECMDEFLNLCSNPNMNRTSSNSFGDRGARYSQLTGTTRRSVRRDSESKNLCWRQKSRYGRQKKPLSSSKDLCLRSECYQISGILPIILNAKNRKTPGISCLIGSASKHVAPQFWFKTQLPLSAPEEKGKQQIHLPYPILLLLYMFGLRIILQSNQSRKTRFKTIPD